MKMDVAELAQKLVEAYMKTSPSVHPKSVLPACAYIAHVAKGMRKTQEEIARTYGVSTPTIRKILKDILRTIPSIGDEDYDDTVRELKGG